jgi:hypothetical protein
MSSLFHSPCPRLQSLVNSVTSGFPQLSALFHHDHSHFPCVMLTNSDAFFTTPPRLAFRWCVSRHALFTNPSYTGYVPLLSHRSPGPCFAHAGISSAVLKSSIVFLSGPNPSDWITLAIIVVGALGCSSVPYTSYLIRSLHTTFPTRTISGNVHSMIMCSCVSTAPHAHLLS